MERIKVLLLSVAVVLGGCAAALVPQTGDPKEKIAWAYWLFDDSLRPLPAENLLHESIEIYKSANDQAGLAEAYKAYGVFLRSYSIEKWRKIYIERGFIDQSVTFENRYKKSISYTRHIPNNAVVYSKLEENR